MQIPRFPKRVVKRVIASTLLSALLFAMPGLTVRPVWAVDPVVTGFVIDTNSTGLSGVQVELHTPDGNTSFTTTTTTGGAYAFNVSLSNGTPYVVEFQAPSDYIKVTGSYNFTYTGVAQTGVNFTAIQAAKTISGTVTDRDGVPITDADISIEPYENPHTSTRVTARTNSSGQWSANVVGGTWFAQASVNLSEYTPQWIAEQAPTQVTFANDASAESSTVNFTVTRATGRVTVQLLNSNSSFLTSSNFVADIAFTRTDGVGTVRKVRQSDSALSVYLVPGIYTISAFHQDLAGKSFNPDDATFTITDGADINLGTLTAQVNSAHLKGKVTNGKTALGNIQLEAIRTGGSERVQGSTDGSGNYDLLVGPGEWSIGVKNFNSMGQDASKKYSQVSPVSATVKNAQTITGLNIVLKTIDRKITGAVRNADGATITDYVGVAYVMTLDKKFKAIGAVENGLYTIEYSTADISGKSVFVGVEAGDGSAYTGSSLSKVSVTTSTTTKNLTVLQFTSSMSGQLVYSDGSAWAASGSVISVDAVDENGNFSSVDVASDGTFTLPLAKGTWYYDYSIAEPERTNGLINRPAGQNKLSISSNQHATGKNMSILKGNNTITGKVTLADGVTPVAAATVTLDNGPKAEDSSTTSAFSLATITTLTDGSGIYSAKVPSGTFLVTVGMTPDVPTTQISPDSSLITISGNATKTKNLKFETTDATVKGKVTTNGKTDGGGTVVAFSDDGAQVKGTIDKNGNYSIKLTKNENWHLQATDLSGKNLLESSQVDFKPKSGTQTVNIALRDSGLDVPGPATTSCAADEPCSVSLPDGTSVFVPAFGIDLFGNVTLTVTPTADLDKTTTDQAASLAYEVKATDSDGYEVKKLLKEAEITLPYDQARASNSGLLENRLSASYYDPATDKWSENGAASLLDTKNNTATITTDHFTKFSVTGMAKSKPRISNYITRISGNTLTIVISGSKFTGSVTATAGSVKAKSAKVSGNTLTLSFDLAKVGRNATKTITVTNSNGRSTSYSQKISANAKAKNI